MSCWCLRTPQVGVSEVPVQPCPGAPLQLRDAGWEARTGSGSARSTVCWLRWCCCGFPALRAVLTWIGVKITQTLGWKVCVFNALILFFFFWMSLMTCSVLICLDFLDAGKKPRIKDSRIDVLVFQGPQGCCGEMLETWLL